MAIKQITPDYFSTPSPTSAFEDALFSYPKKKAAEYSAFNAALFDPKYLDAATGGTNPLAPSPQGLVPGDTTSTDPAAAAAAAASAAAFTASTAANRQTKDLAEGQYKLLDAFGKQRDTKLGGIAQALENSQKFLLENYGIALKGLEGTRTDNQKAEADASFDNLTNGVRERTSILENAATLGAGETDAMRAQLSALRNFNANQGEVNRSFYDTLQGVNRSTDALNSDTGTSRMNLYDQAQSDKESTWANYYNQTADTWTQIQNIENSNNSAQMGPGSVAYKKLYGNAADEAAKATGSSYERIAAPVDYNDWESKGQARERKLTSGNTAATVNLGGPQKRPEGATLRKW